MMSSSKNRKPNFTSTEVLNLLNILEGRRELVCYDSNLFGEELQKAWNEVAVEYCSKTTFRRTGDELKNKFIDLKSRTKKKQTEINTHMRQTGGAPPKELNDIDKLVIKIAGENSIPGMDYFVDSFGPGNSHHEYGEGDNNHLKNIEDTGRDNNSSTANIGKTQETSSNTRIEVTRSDQVPKNKKQSTKIKRRLMKNEHSKKSRTEEMDEEIILIEKKRLEEHIISNNIARGILSELRAMRKNKKEKKSAIFQLGF